MVLGDRCEMVLSMRTEGMARCSQQKDLIKSPLLYIIICITFLYSCPKIASFDGSSTISKGNEHTMREKLIIKEVLNSLCTFIKLQLHFLCISKRKWKRK